jgi:hypothetical protein
LVQADPRAARDNPGYELAKKINIKPTVSDDPKQIRFGQTAAVIAR